MAKLFNPPITARSADVMGDDDDTRFLLMVQLDEPEGVMLGLGRLDQTKPELIVGWDRDTAEAVRDALTWWLEGSRKAKHATTHA